MGVIYKTLKRLFPAYFFDRELKTQIKSINSDISIEEWRKQGSPFPAPEAYKHAEMRRFKAAYGCQLFVETGTFIGNTMAAMQPDFETLYSVELQKDLYLKAVGRFEKTANITILNGESHLVLAELVPKLTKKALFWLDAHYSGGVTARGIYDTPISKELEAVFSSAIDHVVLIDDARLFVGTNDYPTLEELKVFVNQKRPAWACESIDDIIRIHKPV
jgi:hypothetical protein